MTQLKLYYDLISQPSRAIYIFLKKNNILFEGKTLNLFQGDHYSSSFESINPFKRVPVIDDNGFILTESVAILRYICQTRPNIPDHYFPKDLKLQARVDEYLEWQHTNTRICCANYARQKVFDPLITGKSPNEKSIFNLEKKMINTLNELDQIWLKNKQFLCGDTLSIADILATCEIEQTKMSGFDPFVGRSALLQWKFRVQSFLNPYYDEAHNIIQEMYLKYNKIEKNLQSNL
ncbi:glutathione S-transferase theta-1-like [Daktulosphaira vitifoliae]|uniref:glutathione transferase n=1 Tax=Daktulosphaira vitifoliae TaxID=58002 RepID=A0A2I6QGR2_DAKVI|nr:glutathione S-transferase theta-1-like [Daktulosphaira vitifoliae]AUN35384.1 glutathione S-transferase t1 [Daktulosphaira vitifoliae]